MANVIWNALRSVRRCHLYALLLRIKAKVLRQKILTLCDYSCQQQSPLCATLFFLQLRNTSRYSFVPQCKYFSMLCGLNPAWPRTTSAAIACTSERVLAFCTVIAVTRLSPSSTWLGSTLGSSHQPTLSEFFAGCVHTCKTEADSWQLELRASRCKAQKKCQRDTAELT